MLKIKNILFPTDFSDCANQALKYAIGLARYKKATLHFLHAMVLYNPAEYFDNVVAIYDQLKQASTQEMANLVSTNQISDLTVEQVQVPALSASSMIIDYAQQYDIDLIVMGTHGRSGLKHLLMGSIAEQVVRLSSCPVLTARQTDTVNSAAFERILIPIDFSEHSRQALAYGVELAWHYGAEIQLVHVVETPIYPAFYGHDQLVAPATLPHVRAGAEEELTKWLNEAAKADTKGSVHVIEGKAADAITKFAQENSTNLIVLSTHGLTGLAHVMIGSVTERVMQAAPCPIWTVKSFGKSLISKD